MGIPKGWPDYVLHQMVMVTRSGVEVKLSKRAGSYVTIRDLIDEVGRDATRFFLAARRADSQLTFDIDLARSQSNDNPVYYIQYAHARVCSMLRKAEEAGQPFDHSVAMANLALLDSDQEKPFLIAWLATQKWLSTLRKAASRSKSPSTCWTWPVTSTPATTRSK
ncbi:hypothetical protein HAALTHF_19400n [Vreelandella aquamarina]|nr:hypothetical protein HAALTHF_19400n [Halomonas axialensis]